MRVALVAGALLALSCGKLDVEVAGKACPCPSGSNLECDAVCRVCVARGAQSGAACGRSDAGTGDASCNPAISMSDFHAEWVTPNSIYWVWQPDDPNKLDEFQAYRLELTPVSPAGSTRVYDVSTNPELGLYVLPNGGADLTRSTLVTDLDSGVEYSARLSVRDRKGCEFSLQNTAPATYMPTTQVPVEIFGESGFGGNTLGGSVVSSGCQQGMSCFEMGGCELDAGMSKCCDNLRVLFSTTVSMTAGEFSQAYVEFYARRDSSFPAYYSNLWLGVGGTGQHYGLWGWTFPATSGYQRLQFPLRVLSLQDGTRLTHAILTSNPVHQFNWYTCVGQNESAWFDEVYIKW